MQFLLEAVQPAAEADWAQRPKQQRESREETIVEESREQRAESRETHPIGPQSCSRRATQAGQSGTCGAS
jgi:hypothetical protein